MTSRVVVIHVWIAKTVFVGYSVDVDPIRHQILTPMSDRIDFAVSMYQS